MFELLVNGEICTPEPSGPGHILVSGGRIAWMGRERPELPGALEARVTDLEGARVIPGLVDGHVHIAGGGGEAGFGSRLGPVTAEELLLAGITSVVGLLGADDTTRESAGLLASARALRENGVSAWCFTGGYHLPPATLTSSVRGDIVHVDPFIGAGEIAVSDHRSSGPTVDELIRIASEAWMGGMLAGKAGITHFHMGDGAGELRPIRELLARSDLPPRAIQPTHVNRNRALFKEALKLAEHGCPIDVTAFPVAPGEDAVSAAVAIIRYLEAGLPADRITVSSDAGGSLPDFDESGHLIRYQRQGPGALAATLSELLEAGHPPRTVLPAFTSNPARILRLEGKGSIRPGADADLVVLDGSHRIDRVMSGGRWRVVRGQAITEGRGSPDRPALEMDGVR